MTPQTGSSAISPDVIIVGGGIAGLATAYELHRRAVPFLLLERASRLGGVILNEEVDGFTIDAGPDALLIQKPEGIKLCRELGLGDRLVSTKPPRLAYIQRAGQLYPLPAASVLGIPTRVGPFVRTHLFSWPGKMRMGAELLVPARRDGGDESIGAFMTRRFGREATEYLAEPLLAGIHAGDVDRLSLRALFPRFADAEQKYGSLLRAFRSQRASADSRVTASGTPTIPVGASADSGAFKSLPGGLSEIVRALCAVLPREHMHLDSVVTGISSVGGERPYRVNTARSSYDARAVVLAAPAFVTASLVRSFDAELARLCGEVPYASIATVALAFRRDDVGHPLHGSGYVVPRTEGNGILAASWLSSKWPGRAPDGTVLLRTFIGGARNPDALERPDAALVATSLEALRPVLGISGDPLFARVYRFDRANAQHEVGHLDRLAKIDEVVDTHPGLFVTGSGFRGVGIPDCVADGRATGSRAAEWLRTVRV
jgi:oxygen-dependent protoporphyrinogen oxidase